METKQAVSKRQGIKDPTKLNKAHWNLQYVCVHVQGSVKRQSDLLHKRSNCLEAAILQAGGRFWDTSYSL
eukprot:5625043-Amphidinium_carterae.1